MSRIDHLRGLFARRTTQAADGCIVWSAGTTSAGYGALRHQGRALLAHRVAFELANGEGSAVGKVVRHRCDNPPCVNPAHLELGTMADNTADMVARGRARFGVCPGSRHPLSKLDEVDVSIIKLLLDLGVRPSRLARLYEVSATKISQIRDGKSWRHVSTMEAPT